MNARRPFYYRETAGIRISVRPQFLPEQSLPALGRYVFAYFIRIENVSQRIVQLLARHWHIHDSIGEEYEVAGEGVIGRQPVLAPGAVHEYNSFCILKSPAGHMHGTYRFLGPENAYFDAYIPRFDLLAGE
ncbi:Co2+/Mg2+ efflux protein ApaG [Kouleothrix sp.]|uniref:Co2+/Mg2+ efflux protein ApaG n=1 Tax=Kouleothrix sp. TaxID=2779161 RepID=UPI003919F222